MSETLQSNQPVIVLCPGQGAQHVGMAKAWLESSTVAEACFDEAERVTGMPLRKLCLEGPEDELNRTDVAQVAIYVASVACCRAIADQGGMPPITATAGLSLGEFTALHLAGVFDFAAGLKLVQLRGQAMQAAAEARKSGMVALIGADEAQARQVCDCTLAEAGADEVLVPANFNCPGQVVISGSATACGHALKVAEEAGVKATPLKVAGAFHSPIMQPAAEKLGAALDEVQWQTPRTPVMSNVTAEPHEINNRDAIKRRLVEQLTSPVRWEQCMTWLVRHMPGRFVELAPNKVLGGLMRRIDRSVKVENLAEPKQVQRA